MKLISRASAIVLRRERLFDSGMLLFAIANPLQVIGLLGGGGPPATVFNIAAGAEIRGQYFYFTAVYASLQTVGLLGMSLANIDTNLHLRKKAPWHIYVFACMILVQPLVLLLVQPIGGITRMKAGMYHGALIPFGLPCLPFTYLLCGCRFHRVMSMDSQLPRFTELFHYTLVLYLVANGATNLIYAIHGGDDDGILRPSAVFSFTALSMIAATANFAGAAATRFAYHSRRQRGDSLSLALNYSIFWYLLAFGAADLLGKLLILTSCARCPEIMLNGSALSFGPIHILPALYVLLSRSTLYRWLGRIELEQAAGLLLLEGQGISPEDGSLAHIEGVISSHNSGVVDEEAITVLLDAYRESPSLVRLAEGEGNTLLHLACWNGHIEGIQRLLQLGADVHKPTRLQRQPALMLAARRGHAECTSFLLEVGDADVHQKDGSGQTALMAALATKQTATLQVLLANGAGSVGPDAMDATAGGGHRWMDLQVIDAAEMLNRQTALQFLRAYESAFHGNILQTRGGTCVASWPGIYAKLWDKLVAQGRASELSAAVVFLPEYTPDYGMHGSDKCYCVEVSD
jgi:hypothetical protein